jgi:hypothetical protein
MQTGLFHRLRSIGLVLALALSLGATGWGHRLVSPAQSALQASWLDWLAAGGAIGDLCLDTGEDAPGSPHPGEQCLACRLVQALALADPALPHRPVTVLVATVSPAARKGAAPSHAAHPGWASRAPPVS